MWLEDQEEYSQVCAMCNMMCVSRLELITFEILAAEQLRLMGFDNRLIIDCFANVVNILIWLFSTKDRFRSEKYESNYLENPFP